MVINQMMISLQKLIHQVNVKLKHKYMNSPRAIHIPNRIQVGRFNPSSRYIFRNNPKTGTQGRKGTLKYKRCGFSGNLDNTPVVISINTPNNTKIMITNTLPLTISPVKKCNMAENMIISTKTSTQQIIATDSVRGVGKVQLFFKLPYIEANKL